MRKLEVRDHANYRAPHQPCILNNGGLIVYVVTQMDLYENRNTQDLYTYDFASKQSRRLTTDRKTGKYVVHDQQQVLVIRKHPGNPEHSQINKLNIISGEEIAYFTLDFKVNQLVQIAPDCFVFTTVHNLLLDDERFNQPNYEDGAPQSKLYDDYYYFDEVKYRSNDEGIINGKRTHLYLYDHSDQLCTRISPYDASVECFDYDDQQLVYATVDPTNPLQVTHAIHTYQLCDGTQEMVVTSGVYDIRAVFTLPQGLLWHGFDTRVTHARETARVYSLVEGEINEIYAGNMDLNSAPGSDAKLVDGVKFQKIEGKLATTFVLDGRSRIGTIDLAGNIEFLTEETDFIGGFNMADGQIVTEIMTDTTLKELAIYRDQSFVTLTHHNDALLAEVSVAPTETFVFHGNGHDIKGYVMKPIDFVADKEYPAVLFIHGGPRGLYGPIFQHRMQVMANKGYFVFYTNPHGSGSRGNEFCSIFGQHGIMDYEDLMMFTDEVLDRYPQIDRCKLGVTGHSYGGIMTNHIIAKTNRFAAAVSSASLSNFITKAGTTDNGNGYASMQVYGDPWENPEWTWNMSPLKYCATMTTPTLLIHSDADYRCFYAESLQLYTGLKRFGIDTAMYLFKGEPHGYKKPRNRLKWLDVLVDWFEKYLK